MTCSKIKKKFLIPFASLEDVLKYLLFTKLFKPKMSDEASEFVIQEYRGMRERDAQGSARSAWRITVRQLESLIRLSEACARLHCCDIGQISHIFDAVFLNLVQTSVRLCASGSQHLGPIAYYFFQ